MTRALLFILTVHLLACGGSKPGAAKPGDGTGGASAGETAGTATDDGTAAPDKPGRKTRDSGEFAAETDAAGFTEVLVPIGAKYDLVFLSLGRRDIAAQVAVANEPRLNLKLTLRYKREDLTAPPIVTAPSEPAPAAPARTPAPPAPRAAPRRRSVAPVVGRAPSPRSVLRPRRGAGGRRPRRAA